jgi:hypothetical protein
MAISIRAFYRNGHFIVDFFSWLSKSSSDADMAISIGRLSIEMAISLPQVATK